MSSSLPAPTAEEDESPLLLPSYAARLALANINPATGLATDYLNHFNEAIMLLEMTSMAPDCLEDFVDWEPMSYTEHFDHSQFKDRELAVAAYAAADPGARRSLDAIGHDMSVILTAIRDAMRRKLSPETATLLAQSAVGWLKPMVARAGAVINGTDDMADAAAEAAPQAAVDALMEHRA